MRFYAVNTKAEQSDAQVPMGRTNLLPPFSIQKMELSGSSKILVHDY